MMPIMFQNTRTPRVLKDIKVREISMVNRGAAVGAQILLAKREEQPAMSPAEINKRGFALWDEYTALVAKRCNISKAQAITRALGTELGRELFDLAKMASGADVAKATASGGPNTATGMSGDEVDSGGRTISRTLNRPHSASADVFNELVNARVAKDACSRSIAIGRVLAMPQGQAGGSPTRRCRNRSGMVIAGNWSRPRCANSYRRASTRKETATGAAAATGPQRATDR